MKLNWAERWVVNNPLRVIQQRMEINWLRSVASLGPGSLGLEIGCGLILSSALDHKAATLEKKGKTVIFFGWEETVRGLLAHVPQLKN